VLLGCLCAIASATPALATRTAPTKESLVIFEGQLHGHHVSGVTLHTKTHTFHASLKDGQKVSVVFPASQQQRLEGDIGAEGIAVKVAKVQPPPSHKTLYIVGAIVIVVIALAAAGLLLYMRRRRMREDEEGPRASTRYSVGG
jgi:hypothetical protein